MLHKDYKSERLGTFGKQKCRNQLVPGNFLLQIWTWTGSHLEPSKPSKTQTHTKKEHYLDRAQSNAIVFLLWMYHRVFNPKDKNNICQITTIARLKKKRYTKLLINLTFSICPLETKVWATFSKLSFKTSVIADVIASACLEGTPCASKLLTCRNNQVPCHSINKHISNNKILAIKHLIVISHTNTR